MYARSPQLCLTLCNSIDCSPPDSSVHGISHAWMLDCVAISSSRGSSWPWDQTCNSYITGIFFTIWATKEAPRVYLNILPIFSSMLILKKWGILFQYTLLLDYHFDAFCMKNLPHLAPFSPCLNATYKWLMDICDAIKRSVITMPPSVIEYLEF